MNILITGTSSGFGNIAAKSLAKKGHHVFASMRDIEGRNKEKAAALTEWASGENAKISIVELDVTSDESVESAIAGITASDKIDVVVNNAGYGIGGNLETQTADDLKKQFEVNFFGPHRVARAVIPHMRENKSGLLVHISSSGGRVVFPGFGAYVASKWALEGWAEALGDEIKQFGIDTAIIEPGAYPTDFFGNIQQAGDERAEHYKQYQDELQQMFASIMEVFKTENSPNPQEIADAISDVIDKPAGARPLRTAVGAIGTKGVNEYNDAYLKLKKELFEQ